jgi:DNA-binding GntR family transcriptional regulator
MSTGTGAEGRATAEQRLRGAILGGDMAPGQRIVEFELAALYDVTRSSMRLAIDALIADGLVERIPNRGARVRVVSKAEAVEITECRMVLEGLLARKAAEHASADQLEQLRRQAERMRACVETGELLKYSDLIVELYELLRESAQHPTAASLVDRLRAQLIRHQFRLSLRPGRARHSLAGLECVVEAVCDRDGARAEQHMREHLNGVATALAESSDAS